MGKLKQRKRKRRKRKTKKLQLKKRQTLQWKPLQIPVSWRKVERRKRKRKTQSNFYHPVHYLQYVSNLYSVWKKSFGICLRYATSYHVNYENTSIHFFSKKK